MAAFILNWNPSKWDIPEEEVLEAIATTTKGGEFHGQWSVGARKGGIVRGDQAYLLRQGPNERGLVASGYFTGEIFDDEHWDGSGRITKYGPVAWTTWVANDDRVPTEELLYEVPGVPWNYLQASGTEVPSAEATVLADLWASQVEAIGRGSTIDAESAWDPRVLLTLETRMEHGNHRWCAAEVAEVPGRAA